MAEGIGQPAPSKTGLSRTTAKSAATRARIVQGALAALQTHGLSDTTTRRIASEAGLRLATLHYHFQNKEAVLLAVLDGLVGELVAILASGRRRREPLEERVSAVVRMAWAYAEATRSKQIVQFELTLYALRTRGTEWLAVRQYEAYVAAYAEALGQDVDPPAMPEETRRLARFVLSGLDGLLLQHLAGLSGTDLGTGLDGLVASAQAIARLAPAQTAKSVSRRSGVTTAKRSGSPSRNSD